MPRLDGTAKEVLAIIAGLRREYGMDNVSTTNVEPRSSHNRTEVGQALYRLEGLGYLIQIRNGHTVNVYEIRPAALDGVEPAPVRSEPGGAD